MDLAFTLDSCNGNDLLFAQQVGIKQIVAAVECWDLPGLQALRNRVDKAGQVLIGADLLPPVAYARAILGQPGRDAEIAAVSQVIQNLGAAGIGLTSYTWTPPSVARTAEACPARGGATVAAYDLELAASDPALATLDLSAEQLWANLGYFLERVLPVAEKAGVKLACRPDDPPLAEVGGVPRILSTVADLKRLLARFPGPSHGLDLSLGALAQMPDVNIPATLGELARGGRLLLVHLDAREGGAAHFSQTFLDHWGAMLPKVLRALRQAGYAGALIPTALPALVGDTPWGHKSQSYAVGYVRAILQSLS